MQNILVASHPRSGTNLTINLIYLNFFKPDHGGGCVPYLNLNEKEPPITIGEARMEGRIYKTHHLWSTLAQLKNHLQLDWKIIYVERCLYDTLVSGYHYFRQCANYLPLNSSFSDYLRFDPNDDPFLRKWRVYDAKNMVEMVLLHRKDWFGCDSTFRITYEEIIGSTENSIDRLSYFLNHKPLGYQLPSIKKHRSIMPRKGIVGDHKNIFKPEDYEFVNSVKEGLQWPQKSKLSIEH